MTETSNHDTLFISGQVQVQLPETVVNGAIPHYTSPKI